MSKNLKRIIEKSLNDIEDINVDKIDLDKEEDIIEHFGIDSMGTMLFIANLEDNLSKKIDYDSLESDEFKLSISSIIRAFDINDNG